MRELWLVAKHEYLKIVREKSFLIGTLGLPALMAVIMGISVLVILGGRGDLPVGYVDHSGVLGDAALPPLEGEQRTVSFRPFTSLDAGLAALYDKEIQALYLLGPGYLSSGRVELYYLRQEPGQLVQSDFETFLRWNLLLEQPEHVRRRLLDGLQLSIRTSNNDRNFNTEDLLNYALPFGAAIFFMVAVMSSGGYMLQAVTDERENCTLEILMTSVRSFDLIGGKALGLMSVGLTQITLWTLTAVGGLFLMTRGVEELPPLTVPWVFLGIVALFFLPAYAVVAGAMTAIGSVVSDLRQSQQIAGTLNFFFTAPLFLMALIVAKPNSPIVVALSFFPTTAFVTMMLRWAVVRVPVWQIATSWTLLTGSAMFSVWVASRAFRGEMLHTGQRLSAGRMLQSLYAMVRRPWGGSSGSRPRGSEFRA
ncbi:MAG: ABC transporter permease [Anaerolineae bacterium]